MAMAEVMAVDRQGTTNRISWGGVFAGTLLALGVWMLLHTLGLAAGLTALDPDNPRTLRGVGIGTGIWSIIAPLVALFVGGVVSARGAGYVDRAVGAIQGAVVWAFTTVVGALLAGMAIVSMVGLGVRAGAAAAGSAAEAGKALWGVFIALALGLASAVIGGVVGVSQRQRFVAEIEPGPVVTPPVRPAPVGP